MREKDKRLLELHDESIVPEWRRPDPGPQVTRVAADHPVPAEEPGRCQLCGSFGLCVQYWAKGLPARYLDLCQECRQQGELDILAGVDPDRRRDGARV